MGIFDQEQTQAGVPWGPLQDPTLQGVGAAQDLLNRGTYQGPYTAPINAMQQYGVQQGAMATGLAGGVGASYGTAGQQLLPGLGSALQYNQQSLQGSMNPWMTNPAAYFNLAGNAASNPYLEGQITSALRDPYRQFTEQTMPGIGQQFNSLGQSASSRRGIAEGIAARGYEDRAADIGAQMRGQAWNQGMNVANQASMNDYQGQQQAAANLGQFGGQGLGYLGQQYGYGQQGASDMTRWGTQQQDWDNQQIQGQMNQFNAPWANLQSYGSFVNPLAQNLQTQTQTSNQLPAYLLQGLGGVLGSIGGAAGNEISDWLFGTVPEGGGSRTGGFLGGIEWPWE